MIGNLKKAINEDKTFRFKSKFAFFLDYQEDAGFFKIITIAL
jgi:hypothetical protein